ncbi:MAG: hypothetical protein KDE08_03490 [Rhodobacteraceae bacterium]|nr:hypothetical protein [Paracoccaceae bacterium]
MSSSQSNVAIQDVLSSIRRLVSEDLRAEPRQARGPEDATPEPAGGSGKLVLTSALRVAERSDWQGGETIDETAVELDDDRGDTAEAFADGDDDENAAEDVTGGENTVQIPEDWAGSDEPDEVERTEESAGAEAQDDSERAETTPSRVSASLEDTIAELEAAVAGIGEVFEPDGSEVADAVEGEAEEDAPEFSFSVAEDGPEPVVDADPVADGLDAAITDGAMVGASAVVKRGLAVRLGFEDDNFTGGRSVRAQIESPAPDVTKGSQAEDDDDQYEDAAGIDGDMTEASMALDVEEAAAPAGRLRRLHIARPESDIAADEDTEDEVAAVDGNDIFADPVDGAIDREALRALVSEIIRQEMQGPLGERITRNVRKLVRREINRALEIDEAE